MKPVTSPPINISSIIVCVCNITFFFSITIGFFSGNDNASGKISITSQSFTQDFMKLTLTSRTRLSKYVWELMDQGIFYTIMWKMIARGRGFNPTTRSCQACLKDKNYIMFRLEGSTLNDINEFYNTCRH